MNNANDNFLDAILSYIEEEWLRVTGNVYQRDTSDDDPFRNTGNVAGFKTNVFEVHAYNWGWDYEESFSEPVNFQWRDLKIYWYKYCGRGLYTNRPTTHDELAIMLDECLQSLIDWEHSQKEEYAN